MELNFRNELVIKSKGGKDVTFLYPYVNDNKELAFKYCSAFECSPKYKFVLNEKLKGIEFRGFERKLLLPMNEQYENDIVEFIDIKNKILADLWIMARDLKSGKEQLIAFETDDEEYPFLVTSQTIIDNGQYSGKYIKGLIYCFNEKLKELGKHVIEYNNDVLQQKLGHAINEAGLLKCQPNDMGGEKYYTMTINDIAVAV